VERAVTEEATTGACEAYHRWLYESKAYENTTFQGVNIRKSVSDLWLYQEIFFALKPKLVIEFGTWTGGSALYFTTLLEQLHGRNGHLVVTVDVNCGYVDNRAERPGIEFVTSTSTNKAVVNKITQYRSAFGEAPCFAILDSDHSKKNVLAEMIALRSILKPGDYLVVEDGNINGHPVLPEFGPGPYEAIQEYERLYPDDYIHDREREKKFGFTFAPNGFLIRK
jgi:cephalosporin hydroxylase